MKLPTHLVVSGMIRAVSAAGGFAMVLAKGERDAGTMIVVLRNGIESPRILEQMPQLDGTRAWSLTRTQDPEKGQEFEAYLDRRRTQDPDLWIVELDVRDGERFIDGLN